MSVRCVVTGHDDRGCSVIKSDGELEPVTLEFAPGVEFHRVWGADRLRPHPILCRFRLRRHSFLRLGAPA
jgi:hypothetical protein